MNKQLNGKIIINIIIILVMIKLFKQIQILVKHGITKEYHYMIKINMNKQFNGKIIINIIIILVMIKLLK